MAAPLPPPLPPELQQNQPRPPRRARSFRNILSWLFVVTVGSLGIVVSGGYCFYSIRAGLIDPKVVERMPEASILYDCRGYDYGRFFSENRIEMDDKHPVPKLLAEAVIDKEDHRFYEHGAVDWFGIGRAAVSNLLHVGARQGGSTITQQLARNSIGMLQRTYDRKILEIFLAIRIEHYYTKDQILRYYLNRIYFGQGLYGVQTASSAFFGKPVDKLNLAECALLAGIISSPNSSSPWKDVDAARAARSRALTCMVQAGHISQAVADATNAQPITLRPRPNFNGGFAANEVRRQLEGILSPDVIQQGGLKVFTTINSDLQQSAENAVSRTVNELEISKKEGHPNGLVNPDTGLPYDDELQGAFIAIDPAYGSIRAIVGSRDFASSSFNRALLAKRQVGSTIKPLLYATAFAERGYNPSSIIDATPFDLTHPNNPGPVSGDGSSGHRLIRINDALVESDNYAAMRMGLEVGPNLLSRYARNCGVTDDLPAYPSTYLGACDLSLLELTEVYQTLANQGVWVQPHCVIEVRNAKNEVLYHYQPLARQVFSPEVSRQVTGMMENVLDFGTGRPVRTDFHFHAPAAAKTGTTNSYKDCWFEGYTTHLVAGVWIGYDKPKMIMPGGYAARVALPVWARVMSHARSLYAMQPFPVPNTLQEVDLTGSDGTSREKSYLTTNQYSQSQNTAQNTTDATDRSNRPGFFQRVFNFFR